MPEGDSRQGDTVQAVGWWENSQWAERWVEEGQVEGATWAEGRLRW